MSKLLKTICKVLHIFYYISHVTGSMNRHFHPTADRQTHKVLPTAACLPSCCISPPRSLSKMELGPQTPQLLCTQKHSSSGFLNLTYCDAIISNVTGRQGLEFQLEIRTKGMWMGMLLSQIRKLGPEFIGITSLMNNKTFLQAFGVDAL